MNEDLARERAASAINVEALTHIIDGSRAKTLRRREIQAMVEADPIFANRDNMFMSRPERYRHGLRKARRFAELKERLKLGPEDTATMAESIVDTLPTWIHPLMFVPNVEALCDEEQRRYWLPRCHSMEVIGCYAQTELGHGSNIRALETTATFVPESDEFEIHSPSVTATKWWPGTMGRTANHAMVIAQLVIDGKRYGIHNFIVPLRGDDHKPLPGVSVGDIGPKMGFNSMDNGCCAFDRVRIPRTNMAMRYQQVDKDGRYTSNGSQEESRIAYFTMMQVRAHIVRGAGKKLATAVTIATRYSILRRQGFRDERSKQPASGHAEHQILDYTIQMHRLLPLLATSYGFQFAGQGMMNRLRRLERVLMRGESGRDGGGGPDTLKQFHAASSGLKSLCTSITAAGIEDCRKACGGQGYLQSSGIPEHLGTFLQMCTVEGENHMLTQQVVRVLLQQLASARTGGPVGADCLYMTRLLAREKEAATARFAVNRVSSCPAKTPEAMRDADVLYAALEHRAFRLLRGVEAGLARDVKGGKTSSEAWNRALVEVYRASNAHSYLLVFRAFYEAVSSLKPTGGVLVRGAQHTAVRGVQEQPEGERTTLDQPTWSSLDLLLSLLGLYWLQNDMGDFVEDGYLNEHQAKWVREELVEILHLVRPMALSLVDAWDFTDFQLNSAIGRFDGQAYQALLETTTRNPMNQRDPVEGYEDHLEPVIREAREARLEREVTQRSDHRSKL